MKIYIVSRLVEDADGPVSANTESAHVDQRKAVAAAQTIDCDDAPGYAVVESVELDLSGTDLETGALSRMVLDAERRLADH